MVAFSAGKVKLRTVFDGRARPIGKYVRRLLLDNSAVFRRDDCDPQQRIGRKFFRRVTSDGRTTHTVGGFHDATALDSHAIDVIRDRLGSGVGNDVRSHRAVAARV